MATKRKTIDTTEVARRYANEKANALRELSLRKGLTIAGRTLVRQVPGEMHLWIVTRREDDETSSAGEEYVVSETRLAALAWQQYEEMPRHGAVTRG